MTERPIPFRDWEVRAILDGRKTQARRVMKVQPPTDACVTVERYFPIVSNRQGEEWYGPEIFGAHWEDSERGLRCPYGAPGDTLWVRETFCAHWGAPPHDAPQSYRIATGDELPPIKQENGDLYQPVPSDIMTIWHGAQGEKPIHMSWRPSIHMPRWASRITLRITDVRVELLQDISEDDARAEGATPATEPPTAAALMTAVGRGAWFMPHRSAFANLWNRINGPGAWEANPWVWVIEIERVKP